MRSRPDTSLAEHERLGEEFRAEELEPTLFDYARVLWEGRFLILLVTSAVTLAALAVSLNLPKTFVASTTIMPLAAERGGGLASALSGSLGGALGIETSADKLVAVLQSRRVAGAVIDTLGLRPILAQQVSRELTRDEAIEILRKSVITVSGASRGIITVRATWREPALTAAIANAVVVATSQFLNERSITLNFQVLDEAVSPLRPAGPRTLVHVIMALMGGGFIAIVLVFLRHSWRAERARARERMVNQEVSRIIGRGSSGE